MATYYIDTSALVKVYVAEAGTGWVRALCRPSSGNVIFTSRLATIELEVALFRRASERSISEADRDRSVALFRRHVQRRYSIVSLTDEISSHAVQCVHASGLPHPLRTYDALHLASAQLISEALATLGADPMIFVAADRRLLADAQYLGFAVESPEDHL